MIFFALHTWQWVTIIKCVWWDGTQCFVQPSAGYVAHAKFDETKFIEVSSGSKQTTFVFFWMYLLARSCFPEITQHVFSHHWLDVWTCEAFYFSIWSYFNRFCKHGKFYIISWRHLFQGRNNSPENTRTLIVHLFGMWAAVVCNGQCPGFGIAGWF